MTSAKKGLHMVRASLLTPSSPTYIFEWSSDPKILSNGRSARGHHPCVR